MSETLGIFLQYTNEQHEVAMLNQETTFWAVLLFLRGKFTPQWKIALYLPSCSSKKKFHKKKTHSNRINPHYFCTDMSDIWFVISVILLSDTTINSLITAIQ